MDVGTIALPLLMPGALALFLMMLRRLPPREDDVAVVVASVIGTPAELERPPADTEEPIRWRVELLMPPATGHWHTVGRSKGYDVAKPASATR